MKTNTPVPPLSVQSLAEFLRDLAYSESLFHSADWFLSVQPPCADDSIEHFEGIICTHSRIRPDTRHIHLSFGYDDAVGIYNVKATAEGDTVRQEQNMPFEEFRSFAMTLFDVKTLYAPKRIHERQKKRPVRSAPTLLELAVFMNSFSPASGGTADWSLRVLHPRDIWDDIAYSGGLWTHQPLGTPPSALYRSISFSYSKTWGIYDVMAWNNRMKRVEQRRMDFDGLKSLAQSLFSNTTDSQEDTV